MEVHVPPMYVHMISWYNSLTVYSLLLVTFTCYVNIHIVSWIHVLKIWRGQKWKKETCQLDSMLMFVNAPLKVHIMSTFITYVWVAKCSVLQYLVICTVIVSVQHQSAANLAYASLLLGSWYVIQMFKGCIINIILQYTIW